MKFLGLRNGHDCNVTYTDGKNVKYFKLERHLQIKHYGEEFLKLPLTEYYDRLIKKAQPVLGFDLDELDAIAVSSYTTTIESAAQFTLSKEIGFNELYRQKTGEFWRQFKCPVFEVDHHYAHSLSVWPIVNYDDCDLHFVQDGQGEHNRYASVFKDHSLITFNDLFESHPFGFCSFAARLILLGEHYKMSGIHLDYAGKLMALQSFHTLTDELITSIMSATNRYDFCHMNQFAKTAVLMMPQNSDKKEKVINLAHLLHLFMYERLPEYMKSFGINSSNTISFSGGVAQNSCLNTHIRKTFPSLIVPPHSPDDGISLGCVEFLRRKYEQDPFDTTGFPFWQTDEAPHEEVSKKTIDKTTELLAKGKIVAWYQGHGEIGPRALGNRSILMDPTIKNGKDIINNKVKHRESYRPFGASVLLEDVSSVFDCNQDSEYMLFVYNCLDPERYASISHIDGTCRIQTVKDGRFYDLINSFKKKTGIPMILNTSLNVNGKPIAGYTENAKELYDTTEIDAIVIGNEIMVK